MASETSDLVSESVTNLEEDGRDLPSTSTRVRYLSEKGCEYQLEPKSDSLKKRKRDPTSQMRKAILLKGQCDAISKFLQELCKAQDLWSELGDAHCEVKKIVRAEDVLRVE